MPPLTDDEADVDALAAPAAPRRGRRRRVAAPLVVEPAGVPPPTPTPPSHLVPEVVLEAPLVEEALPHEP